MRIHSKTPLFLMELTIMLLVFSISAAICLQVFAGAKRISSESRKLDAAIIHAQTAAEYWKATHGDLEQTAEWMGVVSSENGFVVYDEENWLHMEFTCEETTADIVVFSGENEIFSITCEAVMLHG
ncbi:hypothetical protein [Anaerotignum sp.]